MKLPESELRDIIHLLEAGQPLPDKYRFLLFENKREVELLWNGKTSDVCNVILPFQTIEQVDEPRAEKEKHGEKLDLFATDNRGRQLAGWTNKLIWGDNKLILSSLKSGPLREEIEKQGGLKLIYIDPPFDVGSNFSFNVDIGDENFTKEPGVLEEIAYRDTWGNGSDSFLAMIYERLQLMRDILSDDGILYLHCDWRVGSHIRVLMNEIFGKNNFRNEIVWHYYNKMQGNIKRFASNHDLIYSFKKSEIEPTFLPIKEVRETPKMQQKRYWDKKTKSLKQARDNNGNLIYYEDTHRTIDDVWRLPYIMPADESQKLDYPTQKPESLIDRIISSSSKPGDLVADFFCGSGTTLSVAEKLGRKWIGADLGKFAIHTSRKRLIQVQRTMKAKGADYRAFEVLNLGKYERQHYVGVNPNLRDEEKATQLAQKESHFVSLILQAYRAEPVTNFRTFHGRRNGRLVAIGPVNLPVTRLFVEEIVHECRQKHITRADILGFEFEMGLFPHVQEEAKQKGVDLAMKYIPREVFDKRAVEKNQVVFHDVSYIEFKVHIDKKKSAIAVELTDFSVYYNQDASESDMAGIAPGKSRVIIEQGQVVKISKDAEGKVSREVLTKKWKDWVDYWAVDFDFESKKEIIRVRSEGEVPSSISSVDTATSSMPFEEVWTGDYIFENEWQSFRTRNDRNLELMTVWKQVTPGKRYKIAVKVVDIFGNDTMKIMEAGI